MNIIKSTLLAAALFAGCGVNAATVHLKDGSALEGELSQLRNGVYTLQSRSLGKIEVAQKDVASIEYGQRDTRSQSSSRSSSGSKSEIRQLQESIVNDAGAMTMIQGLANDPEMQSILADPEIMRAVSSGDVNALMNNDKFLKLMNNPALKAVTEQVMKGQ